MSIQNKLNAFAGDTVSKKQPPELPDEEELRHEIAPDWRYDFDVNEVDKIDELRRQIRDTVIADDPIEAWSHIIKDHIRCGNNKLAKEIAIWNYGGAAHDCVNLGTKHCQVDAEDCYAHQNEDFYPHALPRRRREQIITEHLDAVTFAKAMRRVFERKQNEVTALRLNESGDVETRYDLLKINEIGRRLNDIVDTYIYSASDWLPWEEDLNEEYCTVNRSNDRKQFGSRRFEVVDTVDAIPENGLHCPHDLSDGDIKCGDCRLCIDQDAPNVYVVNFYN